MLLSVFCLLPIRFLGMLTDRVSCGHVFALLQISSQEARLYGDHASDKMITKLFS